MELHSVNSSNIERIGYDIESSVLRVQFKGGQVYDYFDVPESVYQDFDSSNSLGHFLAVQIKGVYDFKKVG